MLNESGRILLIFLIRLFVNIKVVSFVNVSNPSITVILLSDRSKYSNCIHACNPHVLINIESKRRRRKI